MHKADSNDAVHPIRSRPRKAEDRCLYLILLSAVMFIAPAFIGGFAEAQAPGSSYGGLNLLLTLPGDSVAVRYTPGSLERAARLQGRLESLQEGFGRWSKLRSRLVVYVLSPEEWAEQKFQLPYGFPVRVADLTVAAPAWGHTDSVALWRNLIGPALPVNSDFQARGTADEGGVVLLSDAFVQLEFCRIFAERERLAGGPNDPWLNELMAHLISLTVDQTGQEPPPADLESVLRSAADQMQRRGLVSGHDLRSYRRDLDLETWLWFQARFAEAARLLWQDEEKDAIKKLIKKRRRKGGPLAFEDLAETFPQLREWRRSSFGDAAAALPRDSPESLVERLAVFDSGTDPSRNRTLSRLASHPRPTQGPDSQPLSELFELPALLARALPLHLVSSRSRMIAPDGPTIHRRNDNRGYRTS